MKRFLLLMMMLIPLVVEAKEKEFRKWEFTLSAGVNNNYSWEVEPGVYMAVPVDETLKVSYRSEEHFTPRPYSENVKNTDGEWLYWNVKSFMQVENDPFVLFVCGDWVLEKGKPFFN